MSHYITKSLAALTMIVGLSQPATAADVAKGEKIFKQVCAFCHQVSKVSKGHVRGPHLEGVVNRPAGHLTDYKYSSGIRRAAKMEKLVWTEANLDKFLEAPTGYIKGTKMVFAGLPDAAERADVIAYLKNLK